MRLLTLTLLVIEGRFSAHSVIDRFLRETSPQYVIISSGSVFSEI